MNFSSHTFIFGFLTTVVATMLFFQKFANKRAVLQSLLLASLAFFGFASPLFLPFLLLSILFNYSIALQISKATRHRKLIYIFGVICNLVFIISLKNLGLFALMITKLDFMTAIDALPLGVSFFSLAQIAYLTEVYATSSTSSSFERYALSVSFFPYVSSGPITRNSDIEPQFDSSRAGTVDSDSLCQGLTIFFIGLFKHSVLSASLHGFSQPLFNAVNLGHVLWWEAWVGCIAYGFQLYFDFSGYSDMAKGVGRIFNFELPWNFDAPYKSTNIVIFWRRWHMTLSDWLRDFVFTPINFFIQRRVSNKKVFGMSKDLVIYILGSFATMLLCGLWHDFTPAFLLWGFMHATFLVICRLFGEARKIFMAKEKKAAAVKMISVKNSLSTCLTFLAVTVAWVPFKLHDLDAVQRCWWAMAGGNGFSLPASIASRLGITNAPDRIPSVLSTQIKPILFWLFVSSIIIWIMPSSRDIYESSTRPVFKRRIIEIGNTSSFSWAVIVGLITVISLLYLDTSIGFAYFKF